MTIERIFSRDLVTVPNDESLLEAAKRMRASNVSALAVEEEGELVAFITERDLVRAMAEGADAVGTQVRDYATGVLVTADVSDTPADVAKRMLELGIRHLPVTDESSLVGIISTRDLLAFAFRR